jgi:hypothetical protein
MVTPVQGHASHQHLICGVDCSLEHTLHGLLLCVQPAYPIPSVHTAAVAVSSLQQAPSAVASVRSDTTPTKVRSPAHANAGCQSPRAPAKTTGQASAVSALVLSAKG